MAFVNNLSCNTVYPIILLIIYLSMILIDFLFAFNHSVLNHLMVQPAVPVNEERIELLSNCAFLANNRTQLNPPFL